MTWQNPGPLGFAACYKQELFDAQVLKKFNYNSVAELRFIVFEFKL